MVMNWLLKHDKYGENGLRLKTKGCHFIPEEKENIVSQHIEEGVTLQQLSLDYNVSRNAIKIWLKIFRSRGSLFDVKKQGRPPKDPMARPKKKESQTELEKLQAENLRLIAEKVRTLVEEQNARARINGQKPLTN